MAGELILPEVVAPTNPTAGKGLLYISTATPSRVIHIDDGPAAHTLVGADTTDALTNKTLILPAGTNALAPEQFTAGTNLSSPVAGAVEFDGAAFYKTRDTTSGRRYDDGWQFFRLTGNGTPFTSITDFFGSTSAIPTVLNAVYEIEWHCYFAIADALDAGRDLDDRQHPDRHQHGRGLVGTHRARERCDRRARSPARRSSRRPTHRSRFRRRASSHRQPLPRREGAHRSGTAGNVRLRAATASTATIGALRDSYFKVRRLPAGNAGTFVA
jgi:hypothetical protein